MCHRKFKAFNELSLGDRNIVAAKFKDSDKTKQKIIRLPAIKSVWLLVPEGKGQEHIIKAQRMIKNFGSPDYLFSTEVPASFLQAV